MVLSRLRKHPAARGSDFISSGIRRSVAQC